MVPIGRLCRRASENCSEKDVPAKTVAVDSRLPSKELGQILLEKEFHAAVNSRDKTNRKKTKSTKDRTKSAAKPGDGKPPAKRGRPKKVL